MNSPMTASAALADQGGAPMAEFAQLGRIR
jgi:hypothetical protein